MQKPKESETVSEKNVALFIDNDNLDITCKKSIGQPYDFDVIINECKKYGRMVQSKIYFDTTGSRKQFESFKRGIEPVYSPLDQGKDGEKRKSLVDPMIICDVMQILYEKDYIDTFIIATGDKDFVPLIRKIHEFKTKKNVIVIGVYDSTADLLINECSRVDSDSKFLDYTVLHKENGMKEDII